MQPPRDHEPAFVALFDDLANGVRGTERLLLGTVGSIREREKSGHRYYYRQFYDATGRRADEYLGRVDSESGEAARIATQDAIDAAKRAARNVRSLAREGYATVDAKTCATLTVLYNAGLLHNGASGGGLVLIGSHAFGALLNHLGVAASKVHTEDIDLARPQKLAIASLEPGAFHALLRTSGTDYCEAPGFRPADPPTTYKERGAGRLRVELLAPTRGKDVTIVALPELGSHAQGLPYLAWLLGATMPALVLGPDRGVPVRVPTPERFALHKLLTSQIRHDRSAKSVKDLQQAATLVTVLAERFDGVIEEAWATAPKSALRALRVGTQATMHQLGDAYPRATAVLARCLMPNDAE